MSNVNSDRRVEHDWWAEPIPPTVQFGAGFYCETAQIFRFVRNRQEDAVKLGDYVSCYAGCSFSLGKSGRCIVGDFTLMNGAIVMAEELIEIGSYCLISWNVGIADSDFHPIDPKQRRDRRDGPRALLQGAPAAPADPYRTGSDRRQRLDRNGRGHFKGSHDRGKFRRRGGLDRLKERPAQLGCGWESRRRGENSLTADYADCADKKKELRPLPFCYS